VPNLIFLSVGFLYKLGLALWLGGGIVLGAIGAPALFRSLEKPAAGALFGSMLRSYSKMRLAVLPVVIAAAGFKYFRWESHATSTIYGAWIAVRWAGLGLMAATLLYEAFWLHPTIARGAGGLEGGSDSDRSRFQRLHGRSVTILKLGLLGAALALLID
jgi:uncharacterized membrane protein